MFFFLGAVEIETTATSSAWPEVVIVVAGLIVAVVPAGW